MNRFGVMWPMENVDFNVHAQSIANTGCKEVRLMVLWDQIEKSEGVYDWKCLDGTVNIIRNHGLGVVPIVYRTPPWMAADRRTPPDPWKYARFLVQVAVRYGFPAYEIWNEPDNPWDLDWTGSAQQYANLYNIAHQALHSYNPGLKAIIGGLTYIDPVAYLGSVWGQFGPIDEVGFHPYGFGNDPVADTVNKTKRLINWLNTKGCYAPVGLTELGMQVGPQSEAQRRNYLYNVALKMKAWSRISRTHVFLWYGTGGNDVWSIATANGTWKGGAIGLADGI